MDRQIRHLRESCGRALREFWVRVDAGADGRATECDFGQFIERLLHAFSSALDLSGIAEELLAESDRRRVLEMRAAGFDDGPELFALLL